MTHLYISQLVYNFSLVLLEYCKTPFQTAALLSTFWMNFATHLEKKMVYRMTDQHWRGDREPLGDCAAWAGPAHIAHSPTPLHPLPEGPLGSLLANQSLGHLWLTIPYVPHPAQEGGREEAWESAFPASIMESCLWPVCWRISQTRAGS